MVTRSLDSNWLRVLAYLTAAATSVLAGVREVRQRGDGSWPAFWFVMAALLGVMGFGRVGGVGGALSEFGRSEARTAGWYGDRRGPQVVAVAVIGFGWLASTMLVVWRVSQRRRRYLGMALVVLSLICFAALRVVSFHRVDTVLYGRHIHGVKVASLAELTGVGMTIVLAAWHVLVPGRWFRRSRPRRVSVAGSLPARPPSPPAGRSM